MDIIEALEKATGPSRELDGDIFRALGPHDDRWERGTFYDVGADIENKNVWLRMNANGTNSAPPHYTASVDAALTLVPDTWTIANMGQTDNKNWVIELRRGFATSYSDVIIVGSQQTKRLASLAIAICVAALKARQQEKPRE